MVFQSTVLGLSLCCIFFSDIDMAAVEINFCTGKFADDLTCFRTFPGKTPNEMVVQDMHNCQAKVHAWGGVTQREILLVSFQRRTRRLTQERWIWRVVQAPRPADGLRTAQRNTRALSFALVASTLRGKWSRNSNLTCGVSWNAKRLPSITLRLQF